MKKRILIFFLCFVIAASAMSITAFACSQDVGILGRTGTIQGNEVRLRSGHSTSDSIGGTLNTGDTMWIFKYFTDDYTVYTWYYGTVTTCTKYENIGLNGWVAGAKGSESGHISF